MKGNKVFLRFERGDYINLKKEILGLIMETFSLRKKIEEFAIIKSKKREIKKNLKERIKKINPKMNKIISYLSQEEKIAQKFIEKKSEEEPYIERNNIDVDLEKELILINKKIEELTKHSL